jgi:hypothetical protein
MRISSQRGQSLVEFALVLPLLIIMALGVIEVSHALFDQHVITKLTREGANLISRDATLQDAAAALRAMSARPVNFDNGSKVIFSVIKRGATTGTPNFDRLILYQRAEFGNMVGASTIRTQGGGAFGGAPNYEAANSDHNTSLRVTSLPGNIVLVRGGMLYVAEIYTRHTLITPFDRFGVTVPQTLYSIAYF